MKFVVEAVRNGTIVKESTLLGSGIKKIMHHLKSSGFPYGGRILTTEEYRPTIPGLLIHLFRFYFIKKSNLSYDSK